MYRYRLSRLSRPRLSRPRHSLVSPSATALRQGSQTSLPLAANIGGPLAVWGPLARIRETTSLQPASGQGHA